MRILIMGFGAVGSAHALALTRAGATVGALVRPHHVERLEAGVKVKKIGVLQRRGSWHEVKPERVFTSAQEVTSSEWDALLITLPSDALRHPTAEQWIAELSELPAILLSPGGDDAEHVTALRGGLPPTRGFIGLVAWPAPLPGEEAEPYTAVWFPQAVPNAFSGPLAAQYVALVKKGGMPAVVVSELESRMLGSATLLPFVAALEAAAWRFANFNGEIAKLFIIASREALAVQAEQYGLKVPLSMKLLPKLINRHTLRLAANTAPFDLEPYLKLHFSKVGGQTTFALERWIEMAEAKGMVSEGMRALAEARGRVLEG